jgi:hypothetical protein
MSTKFEYTREWTDAEAFPLLSFTRNWENPDDYPTIETDEQKVRHDMQSLHDEVKDFLNNELIPRVVAEDATLDDWQAAEDQRVSNEETRVANEEIRVANEEIRVSNEAHREEVTRDAEAVVTSIENMTTEYVSLPPDTPVYVEKSVNEEGGIKLTFGLARGTSGVYIGSGEIPEGCNVKIDPNGDPTDTGGLMFTTIYDRQGRNQDIFKYVDDKVARVDTQSVTSQLNTHNSSSTAHADIRNIANAAQTAANNAVTAVQTAQNTASAALTAANNAVLAVEGKASMAEVLEAIDDAIGKALGGSY